MPRTSGAANRRSTDTPHRSALVNRIVQMKGAFRNLSAEHPHVREAFARVHAEERSLRAKLRPSGILHRPDRKT